MTRLLKYLVITVLVFGSLSSMAQTPTGSKTRTPGVWLSSKDTATNRTTADSIQIIANRADSSLRFYWSVGAPSRRIAFLNDISNSYVPYTDASTVTFKTNNPFTFKSSAGATRYSVDDIDNFNFKLNGSGFDLSAYTRFQITDAIGTRFSIGGDGAVSGLSGTFSSLTNRRVPFVSTGGLLKDTTGFTWAAGVLAIPGTSTSNGLTTNGQHVLNGQLVQTVSSGQAHTIINSVAGSSVNGLITSDYTGTFYYGVNGATLGGNGITGMPAYGAYAGTSASTYDVVVGGLRRYRMTSGGIDTITSSSLLIQGDLKATISTAAQPNITSLGSLTALTMSGDINMQSNSINNGGTFTFTTGNVTGNITVGGAGSFFGNEPISTNATSGNYSYISHKYNGTVRALSGYNSGNALYGGESGTGTVIQANGSTAITINTSLNTNLAGTLTAAAVYTTTVGGTNRDVYVDDAGVIGYVSSIRASKKNIQSISNISWVDSLNTVSFNYRKKDSTGHYTDSTYKELEYGLIAEEVEKVNPELVFYDVDSTGKKKLAGVSYSKLVIPVLKRSQELKAENDRIKGELEAIKAILLKNNIK